MTCEVLFKLLRASLFTNEDVNIDIQDWNTIYREMKAQAVAALPGNWLKAYLPTADSWHSYCAVQQGLWIRTMHAQDQLIQILRDNNIPAVIIKGSAVAVYYPQPMLRSMGDIDVLVKRCDVDRAAELLEQNGYELCAYKDKSSHHYSYTKDKISIELHRRLPIVDEYDEELLKLFELGIEQRIWRSIEGYEFPTLPVLLNGLVLIFHINQHLRDGLGLRQIIDWMMFVNSLSDDDWNQITLLLNKSGVYRLALTVTAMCQRYIGLRHIVDEDNLPIDELMHYIIEKGNFGRKAGMDGKIAGFFLSTNTKSSPLKRLQKGGLYHWNVLKKYPILKPFAWIYQLFRILIILIHEKVTPSRFAMQWRQVREQRKLIEGLGLKMDRTIVV